MEEMLDLCLSPDLTQTGGLGGDNMTAILIAFNKTQPLPDRDPTFTSIPSPRMRSEDLSSVVEDLSIVPSGMCSCTSQERQTDKV